MKRKQSRERRWDRKDGEQRQEREEEEKNIEREIEKNGGKQTHYRYN